MQVIRNSSLIDELKRVLSDPVIEEGVRRGNIKYLVDALLVYSFQDPSVSSVYAEEKVLEAREFVTNFETYFKKLQPVVDTLDALQDSQDRVIEVQGYIKLIIAELVKQTAPYISEQIVDFIEKTLKDSGVDPAIFTSLFQLLFPSGQESLVAAVTWFKTDPGNYEFPQKSNTTSYYNEAVYNFLDAPRMEDSAVLSAFFVPTISDISDLIEYLEIFISRYKGKKEWWDNKLFVNILNSVMAMKGEVEETYKNLLAMQDFRITNVRMQESASSVTIQPMELLNVFADDYGDVLRNTSLEVFLNGGLKSAIKSQKNKFYLRPLLYSATGEDATNNYFDVTKTADVYSAISVKRDLQVENFLKKGKTEEALFDLILNKKYRLYVGLYITPSGTTESTLVQKMSVSVKDMEKGERWYKFSVEGFELVDLFAGLKKLLTDMLVLTFNVGTAFNQVVDSAINTFFTILRTVINEVVQILDFVILLIKILRLLHINYIAYVGGYTDLPDAWMQVKSKMNLVESFPTFVFNMVLAGPKDILKFFEKNLEEVKKIKGYSAASGVSLDVAAPDAMVKEWNPEQENLIVSNEISITGSGVNLTPLPVTANVIAPKVIYDIPVSKYTGVV